MSEGTVQLREIKCSSCGGEIQFDPETQVTICNFCGNSFSIEQAKTVDAIVPEGIFPFKVTKEQFDASVLEWLSTGDYTPDDVLSGAVLKKVTGIYLPFYLYTGEYEADWSASSGYDRKEEYRKKGSDGKYYTETRTVTDWRPSSGHVSGKFHEFGSASALLPREFARFCEYFSLQRGDLKKFDKAYTLGFGMEPFALTQEACFDSRVSGVVNSTISLKVSQVIPGDRKKDVHWTPRSIRKKSNNMYLPYWLATYEYSGNKYACVLDGQDNARITGSKPKDESRIRAVQSFPVPFYLTIAMYVIASAVFLFNASLKPSAVIVYGYGIVPVVLSGLVAWYRKRRVLTKSKQLRNDALQKVRDGGGTLCEDLAVSETAE